MLGTLIGQIGAAVTLLACLYAFVHGGAPERAAATAILVALAVEVLAQDHVHFLDPQRRLLAIDVALTVNFGVLMSTSSRKWLLWATACQILSTTLHFAALWSPEARAYAFLALLQVLGYGQLVALVGGTMRLARLRAELIDLDAAARAEQLALDFEPDVALAWVSNAMAVARGKRRKRLRLLYSHLSARIATRLRLVAGQHLDS
jgi:hypothetical protein